VRQLLDMISTGDKAKVIAQILSTVSGDLQVLQALVNSAIDNRQASVQVSAALNVARFSQALAQLQQLIKENADESAFQALLTDNPWMFGSEYSELLNRRGWTQNEVQDFALRRTVDGYLEIVEIKTPLEGRPLFLEDKSHATLFQRAELSVVIGQVLNYLEKLDADRYRIIAENNEDTNKARAKIIVGRDGDERQIAALRRLNGHLHRVEIITFDQLVRIAGQVLKRLQEIITPPLR